MWKILEHVYQADGTTHLPILCRQFFRMEKDNNETAKDWIGRVKHQIFELNHLGLESKLLTIDVVRVLMGGPPPSYNTFVKSISKLESSLLIINYVGSRIISEESTRLEEHNPFQEFGAL